MDKNVDDILSKSQYGQKRNDILSRWTNILSKSQYGQNHN